MAKRKSSKTKTPAPTPTSRKKVVRTAAKKKSETSKKKTSAALKTSGNKKKATTRTSKEDTVRKQNISFAAADDRLQPNPGEVIVRMYRQGLGDCFLLAFGVSETEASYVLIDCGVHMRQTNGRQRLQQVMNNIVQVTGGHLDVVVATHEHADHLSGFVQKGSPFLLPEDQPGAITIDQVWMAWTEKPGDQQADALRKKRGFAREKIKQAVEEAKRNAKRSGSDEKETQFGLAGRLETIISFDEPAPDQFDTRQSKAVLNSIESLAGKNAEKKQILERMINVSAGNGGNLSAAKKRKNPSANEMALFLLAMKASAIYCEPGQRLKVPKAKGVRAFAFGPPRNETLLKKDLPSKVRGGHDHEFHETYLAGSSISQAFALSPALDDAPAMGQDDPSDELNKTPPDLQHPFASSYRRKLQKQVNRKPRSDREIWDARICDITSKETKRFFKDNYETNESWRQIESDWLGSGEQLALNLDSDTNNASLVLAFELGAPGEGSVLLFPGDAQVGNWLSWRDRNYPVRRSRTMSADDLIRRTVLYKVGHHGSHNATLKNDPRDKSIEGGEPYGLELMNDIIALIPVDRAAADKKIPRPWKMPQKKLYERLREKSGRRILRADNSIKPLRDSDARDIFPGKTSWTNVPGKPGYQWRRAKSEFEIDEAEDKKRDVKSKETRGPIYFDIRIPVEERDT